MKAAQSKIPRPLSSRKQSQSRHQERPATRTQQQKERNPSVSQTSKKVPLNSSTRTPRTPRRGGKAELIQNLRNSHKMADIPKSRNMTPISSKKVKEKKRLTLNLESTNQTKFVKSHVLELRNNLYKLVGSLNSIEQIFLSLHGLEVGQSDPKFDMIMDKVLGKFNQVFKNFVVDLFFSEHFQLIGRVEAICHYKGQVDFKDLITRQIKNVIASDFKGLFVEKKQEEKKIVQDTPKREQRKSAVSANTKAGETATAVESRTKRDSSHRGSKIGPSDQIRDAIFAAKNETKKRNSCNVPKSSTGKDEIFGQAQEIKIPVQGEQAGNAEAMRELTESYYSAVEEEQKQIPAREREKTASPKKRPDHGRDRKDIENKADKFPEMRNYSKKAKPTVEKPRERRVENNPILKEMEAIERERAEKRRAESINSVSRPRSVRRPSHIPKQEQDSRPTSKHASNYRRQVSNPIESTPKKRPPSAKKVEEMKEKLSALVERRTPQTGQKVKNFSPPRSKTNVSPYPTSSSRPSHNPIIDDLIALPGHLQNIQHESISKKHSVKTTKTLRKGYGEAEEEREEVPKRSEVDNDNIKSILHRNKRRQDDYSKKDEVYSKVRSPYKESRVADIKDSTSSEFKNDSFKHSGINLLKYGSDYNPSIRSPEISANDKILEEEKTKQKDLNVDQWTSMVKDKKQAGHASGEISPLTPKKILDVEDNQNNVSFVSPNKSMKSYLDKNDEKNFGGASQEKKETRRDKENILTSGYISGGKDSLYNDAGKSNKKNRVPEQAVSEKILEHSFKSNSIDQEKKAPGTKSKAKIVEDLIESFTKEVELEILGKSSDKMNISYTENERAVRSKYSDEYDDLNKFSFLPKNMNKKYLKASPLNAKKDTSAEKKRPSHNFEYTSRSKRDTSNSARGWREDSRASNKKENVREKISIMGKSSNSISRPYNFKHGSDSSNILGYDKSKIPKLNSGRSPYTKNITGSYANRSTYSRNLSSVVPGLKNLSSYTNNSRYTGYTSRYNPSSSITSRHNRNRTMDDNTLSSYRASSSYKKPDPMKYRIVNGKVEYINK